MELPTHSQGDRRQGSNKLSAPTPAATKVATMFGSARATAIATQQQLDALTGLSITVLFNKNCVYTYVTVGNVEANGDLACDVGRRVEEEAEGYTACTSCISAGRSVGGRCCRMACVAVGKESGLDGCFCC